MLKSRGRGRPVSGRIQGSELVHLDIAKLHLSKPLLGAIAVRLRGCNPLVAHACNLALDNALKSIIGEIETKEYLKMCTLGDVINFSITLRRTDGKLTYSSWRTTLALLGVATAWFTFALCLATLITCYHFSHWTNSASEFQRTQTSTAPLPSGT